jgi:hypothetical protein
MLAKTLKHVGILADKKSTTAIVEKQGVTRTLRAMMIGAV